ncbi:MAG: DUF421 domain-containing protein [Bacteroidota bacterium]
MWIVNILTITIKILTGLVILFTVTKVLGKTQISQITPFDFISSIVMGELFVHGVFEEKANLGLLFYPIVLWGLLIFAIELLAEKILKLRGFFEGSPSIVIRDGQIDKNQLKWNKINLNQLLNLLRQKDVFSLSEVKYAILEMNGSLSVLKNAPDASPSRRDLNLPDMPVYLPTTVISDGQVLLDNLQQSGLNRQWLESQLLAQGVKEIKDVFYAEWRPDKGLIISRQ